MGKTTHFINGKGVQRWNCKRLWTKASTYRHLVLGLGYNLHQRSLLTPSSRVENVFNWKQFDDSSWWWLGYNQRGLITPNSRSQLCRNIYCLGGWLQNLTTEGALVNLFESFESIKELIQTKERHMYRKVSLIIPWRTFTPQKDN